jgi:hypothetical protein
MPGQHAGDVPTSVAHDEHGHVVHPIAGAYARQLPATQTCVAVHTVSQAPQWIGSLPMRSTHALAAPIGHDRAEPTHFVMHAPALQNWPLVHAVPHAPQSFGSDCVFTHAPPQSVRPGRHAQSPVLHACESAHATPHPPVLHACESAHATPHPPHESGSAVVAVHDAPHVMLPLGQAHAPATHDPKRAHAMPHPPQLLASIVGSTHWPPHET